MNNPHVVEWVKASSQRAELVLSVCSGARILAKSGVLDGLEATTHHEVIMHLRELAPDTIIREDVRFVDTGKVLTSGGISAGIDLSFHIVQKLLGEEIAAKTARYMEYNWKATS
jgi:transcriptional regulator GlxA family with amidase domain